MRQTKPRALKRNWQETKKLWLQQNVAIQKRYFVFLLKLQFLRKTTTKRPKRLETKKSFATICFCQNFAAAANGSFL